MTALIPFIARLAENAPSIIESDHSPSLAALEMFRTYSRRHVMAALKRIRFHRERLNQLQGIDAESTWREVLSDCQALFLTEMLGRLWGGILSARGQQRAPHSAGNSVGKYVLLQFLELRREILSLMNQWCSEAYPQVAELDFHCRRMERWNDILLGPHVREYGLQEFVFDVERAEEYSLSSSTTRENRAEIVGRLPRKMAIEGFLQSYRMQLAQNPLLRECQTGMIRSILGSLPDDPFFSEQRYLLGRIWAESELNREFRVRV